WRARTIDDIGRRITDQIPHLRRYALALLGDHVRADDLVQDCLERAWSRLHLWRRGNLRGWLFTIMHNLNANDRRRRHRAPWTTPLDEAGPGGSAAASQEGG